MKKKLASALIAGALLTTTGLTVSNTYASTGGKTASQAINWVKSLVGQGIDYDGAYGNQCVDLVKAYYNYLGNSPVRGNATDYTCNFLPSGWSRIQGAVPKKGDILIYTGTTYGHVAIYESDYITYHQNFSWHDYVECVTTIKYNGLTSPKYWGVIRPDFDTSSTGASNPSTDTPVAPSIDGSSSSDQGSSSVSKPSIVSVTSVTISAKNIALDTGDSAVLNATIKPSNATNKGLTWKSSNNKVATVSSSGLVKAIGPGTATITVTSKDGAKTSSSTVKVIQPVTSLKLNKSSEALRAGEKVNLIATIAPSNASNKNVNWSSSDTSVATVDSKGNVLAIAPGLATITARSGDGACSANYNILVGKDGWYTENKEDVYYEANRLFTGFTKAKDGKTDLYVKNGLKFTGWLTGENNSSDLYYKDGVKHSGWVTINKSTYYFKNGAYLTGKQTIAGKAYTFDSKGILKN